MDGNRHLKRQVRTNGQTHRSADVLTYIRTDALTYIRAPDFVNAPPKLRFAVRKVKKWLYGKVLLCQEESFCKERTVFG